jgi:SPP1 gp7 family putative phage head morphogenesis protein
VITSKAFDQLADDARSAAFTVTGVYKTQVLGAFKVEVTEALAEGKTQKETIDRFRSILDGAAHRQLGDFHLETVFRTNMGMAYGVGRRQGLEAVKEDLPFWEYHAVMDDRTRPAHAALSGMILRADSPFWNEHFPPWGFNCRCTVTATDGAPDGYDHFNPSGEAKLFYNDDGTPGKAEMGTTVYDLEAQGFPGVPPQGGLRETIEAGVGRVKNP